MKLSDATLEVLGNFATINQGIVIHQGNTLKTISPGRHIYAEAPCDVSFPKQFAINDLKQLLNVIDLFSSPEIEFGDSYLVLSGQHSKSRYLCSPEKHVQGYNVEKGYPKLQLPDEDAKFELSEENLAAILRAGQVMQMPHIAVRGEDGIQKLVALNMADDTTNTYELVVGETPNEFEMIYTRENWRFLSRTYQVTISTKGLASFKSKDVTYFVAAENPSTFRR